MWWTQSKAISHLRDMLRNGASVEACIERLIAIDASLPKYVQCRNGHIGYRNGVPVFNYCNRYECWFHGSQRIHQDQERLLSELVGYNTSKQWYFVTIGYEDTERPTDTEQQRIEFQRKVRDVLKVWAKHARRHSHKMRRAAFYGFKASGQEHCHVVSDWLPSDTVFKRLRTSRDGLRQYEVLHSNWMRDVANNHETIVHIEVMNNPISIANYAEKNIISTIGKTPSGTVRCSFSASWRRKVDVMAARIKIKKCLRCGQVVVGNQKLCHCGSSDWSHNATLYRTAEKLPKMASATLYISKRSQDTENAPLKRCTQCDEEKPAMSPYFHYDRGKLESACADCRTKRNHTPKRRRMFKASRHNRRAREAGRRHSKAIEGTYRLTSAEVEALYARNGGDNGKCGYCGHPLAGDWSIDHVMPLSRGGSNETSNLMIVHSRCNSRKGDMTPEQWSYICASRGIVLDGITPSGTPIQKRLEMDS